MTDENTAKLKLRMGLNLNSLKMYARLRFRTEPISPFDLGEGEKGQDELNDSKYSNHNICYE